MKWISIKKSLPPEFERVLLTDGSWIDFGWITASGWYCLSISDPGRIEKMSGITHYIRLPKLPKTKGET